MCQIFPSEPQESTLHAPGHVDFDWFIRDFGIIWRDESTTPDLKVDIPLAPIPDGMPSGFVDMTLVKAAFDAPYVVISRTLLIKMISSGFEIAHIPRC